MKRIVVGMLLAMALVLTAGPAVPSTTTSCGMAYISPFPAYYQDTIVWGNFRVYVSNITDDTVHVKITLYFTDGSTELVWETDIAPNSTYSPYYRATNHPLDPQPTFYGKIEWTAQFCTQKALIANGFVVRQGASGNALATSLIPVNNGLPF